MFDEIGKLFKLAQGNIWESITSFWNVLYGDTGNIFYMNSRIIDFVLYFLMILFFLFFIKKITIDFNNLTKKELLLKVIILVIGISSLFGIKSLSKYLNGENVYYVDLDAITFDGEQFYNIREEDKNELFTRGQVDNIYGVDISKGFNQIFLRDNSVSANKVLYKSFVSNLNNNSKIDYKNITSVEDLIRKELNLPDDTSIDLLQKNYKKYGIDLYVIKDGDIYKLLPYYNVMYYISNGQLTLEDLQEPNVFFKLSNSDTNTQKMTEKEKIQIAKLNNLANKLGFNVFEFTPDEGFKKDFLYKFPNLKNNLGYGNFIVGDNLNKLLKEMVKNKYPNIEEEYINSILKDKNKLEVIFQEFVKTDEGKIFKTQEELKNIFGEDGYSVYQDFVSLLSLKTQRIGNYNLYFIDDNNINLNGNNNSQEIINFFIRKIVSNNREVINKYIKENITFENIKQNILSQIEDQKIKNSIKNLKTLDEFKNLVEKLLKTDYKTLMLGEININKFILAKWKDEIFNKNGVKLGDLIIKDPITLYVNLKEQRYNDVGNFVNLIPLKGRVLDKGNVYNLSISASKSYIVEFDKDNGETYNKDFTIFYIPLTNKIVYGVLQVLNMILFLGFSVFLLFIYNRLLDGD